MCPWSYFTWFFNKRKLWKCNETMKIATIQLSPRFCHAFSTEKYTISCKLNVFQSNQITFIVTSSQHMCLDECEILESVLQTVQKQLTYRQYHYILIQMTMCNIHIHILSTHSVLLDILTVINTHYTPYVHILHYVHIYTYTVICKGAVDYT